MHAHQHTFLNTTGSVFALSIATKNCLHSADQGFSINTHNPTPPSARLDTTTEAIKQPARTPDHTTALNSDPLSDRQTTRYTSQEQVQHHTPVHRTTNTLQHNTSLAVAAPYTTPAHNHYTPPPRQPSGCSTG